MKSQRKIGGEKKEKEKKKARKKKEKRKKIKLLARFAGGARALSLHLLGFEFASSSASLDFKNPRHSEEDDKGGPPILDMGEKEKQKGFEKQKQPPKKTVGVWKTGKQNTKRFECVCVDVLVNLDLVKQKEKKKIGWTKNCLEKSEDVPRTSKNPQF